MSLAIALRNMHVLTWWNLGQIFGGRGLPPLLSKKGVCVCVCVCIDKPGEFL